MQWRDAKSTAWARLTLSRAQRASYARIYAQATPRSSDFRLRLVRRGGNTADGWRRISRYQAAVPNSQLRPGPPPFFGTPGSSGSTPPGAPPPAPLGPFPRPIGAMTSALAAAARPVVSVAE